MRNLVLIFTILIFVITFSCNTDDDLINNRVSESESIDKAKEQSEESTENFRRKKRPGYRGGCQLCPPD